MAQGPMSSILVMIRITIRIQKSEVRNPDLLDTPLTLHGDLGLYIHVTSRAAIT